MALCASNGMHYLFGGLVRLPPPGSRGLEGYSVLVESRGLRHALALVTTKGVQFSVKVLDGKELDLPQSPFGTIEYRDSGLAYGSRRGFGMPEPCWWPAVSAPSGSPPAVHQRRPVQGIYRGTGKAN